MKSILAAAAICCAQAAAAAPNVLLVIADDMGVDASPCHAEGSSMVRMPVLKGLCNSGMVFENSYAAPVCSPTRAMMLTGRYGSRTGVGGAVARDNPVTISDREASLFDGMGAAGYSAAIIGKWHLSAKRSDLSHPARLGAGYHFGPASGGTKDYYGWAGAEQGRRIKIKGYITSELTDKAITWTADQKGPWFLWLAYTAPHTPFHAPPKELHSFGKLAGSEKAIRRDPRKHYFAALEALDTELGRLLDSLGKASRANTVVMFIGDNGSPGQLSRASGSRARAKGSLYDGGTRVPLMVSGPGISRGRSDALVNATDIYATVLALAGRGSAAEDSISFLPVLRGAVSAGRVYAYAEHFTAPAARGKPATGWAIRDARYKLVQKDGQPAELFDMTSRRGEAQDLLAAGAKGAAETATRLAEARVQLLR